MRILYGYMILALFRLWTALPFRMRRPIMLRLGQWLPPTQRAIALTLGEVAKKPDPHPLLEWLQKIFHQLTPRIISRSIGILIHWVSRERRARSVDQKWHQSFPLWVTFDPVEFIPSILTRLPPYNVANILTSP